VERRRDAFLLHQTTRLKKTPSAVGRKFAIAKRKLLQGNSGPHDVDLILVATELNHGAEQRCGADKNSSHELQHFLCRLSIGGLFHVDEHIRAMERNDSWIRPGSNQRQKMDGDVSEENVEQSRVFTLEDLDDRPQFAGGKLPRPVANLSKPETPEKMRGRLPDDVDLIKWKFFGIFPLLRNYDRPNTAKSGELPVNVQHFRFKERRAIERDDRARFRRAQRLESNIKPKRANLKN